MNAQQPAAPPNLDAIPEKMPFNNAYGVPISLQHAHGKSFTNSTGSRSRRATFDRSTTICPTDPIDVVIGGDAGLLVVPMRWQLIPPWWKKSLDELRGLG